MVSPGSGRSAGLGLAVTSRGIGFLLVALGALVAAPLLSLPALLTVTALLVGLVGFGLVYVLLGHSSVHATRRFEPPTLAPGETADVILTVSNSSPLPVLESTWSESVGAGLAARHGRGVLPALSGKHRPGSRVSTSYEVTGRRRGRHRVGPLRIRAHDPFGVAERRQVLDSDESLVVLPAVTDLRHGRTRGAAADGASRPAPQHVGAGEADVVARSYLPGDALKRMHWKATAHRGEFMVRQEEQQIAARASVVLDLDATSYGMVTDRRGVWEDAAELEWAITAAASIVKHLAARDYVVVARSTDGTLDRTVSPEGDTLIEALVDLAGIAPQPPEPVRPERVRTDEQTVIAILGAPGHERAGQWVDALAGSRAVDALVAVGTATTVIDRLQAAGWSVVRYRVTDHVADRWSELERIRRHVVG